ncbi:OA1 [Acanthosepion pharaonis]|uniref:OA1 n=1 Tax=Acanthosepion pharaonis TaxID=158019 RepID=A0A812CE34_ACAPH|nr:OA1 [Sepia pharaonis]
MFFLFKQFSKRNVEEIPCLILCSEYNLKKFLHEILTTILFQTTLLIPGLKLPKPQPLNEVIRWLAVADILMALGFFTRSIVWLLGQTPYPQIPKVSVKHEVCVAVTVWIEFCCISTYMWNFTYGLDVFLVTHNKSRLKFLWPVLNWIIPGLLTGVGAFYIYYPSLSQCGGPNMKEVVNYVAYFFPMSLVIVFKSIVIRQHGRYSGAEQTLVQNAKRKFYLIMTVFIACWFPNVINAILDAFQFTNSLGKAMWAMWVLKTKRPTIQQETKNPIIHRMIEI